MKVRHPDHSGEAAAIGVWLLLMRNTQRRRPVNSRVRGNPAEPVPAPAEFDELEAERWRHRVLSVVRIAAARVDFDKG